MRPQTQFWNYNAVYPWQQFYYSHLIVWDGSTRVMWEETPARLKPPCDCDGLPCKVYIDPNPKRNQAFGMIIPEAYYDALVQQYLTSASPMAFMADLNTAYVDGTYPATFQAAAMHVFDKMSVIYRVMDDCCTGIGIQQERRNCTGVMLIDVKQNWFSESSGPGPS